MQTSTALQDHASDKNKRRVLQKHAGPLTENGFTVPEELEILSVVERVRRGEEKIYSAEEAACYLDLDG